jgi:ATPase family AAA domain-containing protein 3A/B
VTTVDIGEDEIERVVADTKGFSGRAISKLAIAWQAAAYGTDGAILDQDTFFKTVELHKKSMSQKEEWIHHAHGRADMLTTDR